MAIKQAPNTILNSINDPIASQTEIALATANGGIYAYQTTKDVYVTAVSQSVTTQVVKNYVNDVAGSITGEIQFVNNGTFDADKDFRYDSTTDSLIISGNVYAGKVNLQDTSNLAVGGGNPGDVLSTNGSGALTWVSQTVLSSIVATNVSFVPTANVTSGDIQSAITELGNEKLPLAGGIMTGPLYLAADPTAAQGAATKNYVDLKFNAGVANANLGYYAGNVTIAAQPNITSLGTLISLDVTGNVTSGNLVTAGLVSAAGNVTGGNLSTTGAVSATGNIDGGNVNSTGVVSALGNVTGGNLTTSGNVVASGNVQADTSFVGDALTTRTGPLSLTATGVNNITLATGTGNIDLSPSTYITNVADPVSAQDAATKSYVDAVAQGLKPKASVQCATTTNITLAPAPAVIDGHTLLTGDRVLVKNQTATADNGVYSFDGTNLVRSSDGDTAAEFPDGTLVFIENGTVFATCGFVQTSDSVVTLGVDPIVFTQFYQAPSYTAGTALTLTGTQFSVAPTAVTSGGYGNATDVPSFTVSSTGQLTSATTTPVIANAQTLAGSFLKSTVVGSSLTSVGTLGTLTVTGNANVGNIGAAAGVFTTVAGSLTTAAQPNITSVGTLTSLGVNGTVTATNLTANTGVITGNGNGISNLTGANVTGQVANALVAGTVYLAAQPNITSVGTLATLTVTGNANVGNIGAAAGVFTTVAGGLTTASQPNITSVGTLTSLGVNGTVTATNLTANTGVITGNGNGISNLTGANVTGQVANALVAGTVYLAAQPNITSTGTLTSLTVSGNANVGNIGATNGVFTTISGNLSGNVGGDGGNLSNITGANVVGNVTSAITANFANFAGNVTVAAQPNITSVGTLTGITSTGTANFIGASNVSLGPVGNVHVTGGAAGQVLGTDGTGTLSWVTIGTGSLSNGSSNVTVATNGNISMGAGGTPNQLVVTSTGVNVAGTFNAVGNANVGNIGATNGVFTTVAGSLTTAAQPNITSVGTLTSLTVSGNVGAGNVNATGGVFTYVKGDGGNLSNITGANVVGNVTSAITANFANFAGNVTVAAQPNITSVGTLTGITSTGTVNLTGASNVSLGPVGNVKITGGSAGQYLSTSGTGVLSWVTPAGALPLANGTSNVDISTAGGSVTVGVGGTANVLVVTTTGANIAGTANITGAISTASTVTATGNVAGGNITTGGQVVATGNVAGGNINTTGQVVATGNITSPFFMGVLANTTSRVSIPVAAGNVAISVASSNIIVATSTGANVTGYANVSGALTTSTLAVSGTTNLGAVGNVTITGGTSGQYLQTNGSGVLTWVTPSAGSSIANGTSNISVINNGNVGISAGGTANVLVVTSTGANITGTANITGAISTASTVTAAGSITGGNLITAGYTQTPNLTTGAAATAGTMTGNWTLTAGSRMQATYADLAERYSADQNYAPGTLLMIGGDAETTLATYDGRHRLAGVVSTDPAYVLNATAANSVILALIGRVPCLVTGNIAKGDMLTISNIDGVATSSTDREYGTIIGRALESYNDSNVGTIEIKVDRA